MICSQNSNWEIITLFILLKEKVRCFNTLAVWQVLKTKRFKESNSSLNSIIKNSLSQSTIIEMSELFCHNLFCSNKIHEIFARQTKNWTSFSFHLLYDVRLFKNVPKEINVISNVIASKDQCTLKNNLFTKKKNGINLNEFEILDYTIYKYTIYIH